MRNLRQFPPIVKLKSSYDIYSSAASQQTNVSWKVGLGLVNARADA